MQINSEKPENRELSDLVDIRDVKVDQSLSREDRIRSFVEQVKDPYYFKGGDVKVRISYDTEKDRTLNDSFQNMIASM